jgi:hypothetical protein
LFPLGNDLIVKMEREVVVRTLPLCFDRRAADKQKKTRRTSRGKIIAMFRRPLAPMASRMKTTLSIACDWRAVRKASRCW